MRRAIRKLAFALLAAALIPAAALASAQVVNAINGIGLVDYHSRPDVKVGTWAKYHVTSHSALGLSDDYTVTVAFAGEERFWGDDGLWIETLTEPAGRTPSVVATLMSYAIFEDSLAFPHMQFYIRKTINELDEAGNPIQIVAKRPPETLVKRDRKERNIRWYIDTVGTDTARVAKGVYFCQKVHIRQAVGAATDVRDSSVYTEVHEDRDSYVAERVPLTRIVREDIDYLIKRKSWLIGRSQDAPENIMERSRGQAVLVDYGEGYPITLVPEPLRRTLKEQDRAVTAAPASAPHRKSGSRKPR